jgi:predicted nucleic acid-binding Zn ribbon protein
MARDGNAMYAFVCPNCTESLDVDRGMRDALLQHGCITCDASLTADAFTRIESPDST